MKIKLLTLTGLLAIASILPLRAQEPVERLIESFFTDYEEQGAAYAVDELYKTNPWTARIPDAINNVKNQLARFNEELVGPYYGYEKLVKKKLGESYVLYAYFMKFDRQFLRLTFQFYKPKDEWRLFSFQFDDSFDDDLEEVAKMYHLKMDN